MRWSRVEQSCHGGSESVADSRAMSGGRRVNGNSAEEMYSVERVK